MIRGVSASRLPTRARHDTGAAPEHDRRVIDLQGQPLIGGYDRRQIDKRSRRPLLHHTIGVRVGSSSTYRAPTRHFRFGPNFRRNAVPQQTTFRASNRPAAADPADSDLLACVRRLLRAASPRGVFDEIEMAEEMAMAHKVAGVGIVHVRLGRLAIGRVIDERSFHLTEHHFYRPPFEHDATPLISPYG
jgi:hypothetical protein